MLKSEKMGVSNEKRCKIFLNSAHISFDASEPIFVSTDAGSAGPVTGAAALATEPNTDNPGNFPGNFPANPFNLPNIIE